MREVDVLDVMPPQVFLSYQWGHDKSTQKMVREERRRIKEQTSLQCWFDVEGSTAGKIMCRRWSRECLTARATSTSRAATAGGICSGDEAGKYITPESGWKGDKGRDRWRIAGIEESKRAVQEVQGQRGVSGKGPKVSEVHTL